MRRSQQSRQSNTPNVSKQNVSHTKQYFSPSIELKKEYLPVEKDQVQRLLLQKISKYINKPRINISNVSQDSSYMWPKSNTVRGRKITYSSQQTRINIVEDDNETPKNNESLDNSQTIWRLMGSSQKARPQTQPISESSRQNKMKRLVMMVAMEPTSPKTFIKQLLAQKQEDIDYLSKNNIEAYFTSMIRTTSISIDLDDLALLEFCLVNTAEMMLKLKIIDQAVFFYNQLVQRIFYTFTLNHSGKCQALQGLADCCTQMKQPDSALKYLKRGLQYAWFMNDEFSELCIYEKMALNYFYQGHVDKSQFFHQRALSGGLEENNSPVRMLSVDHVVDYTKNLYFTFTNITTLLLTYMSIPLCSLKQMNQVGNRTESVRAAQDPLKNNIYQTANANDLIEHLLTNDLDFIHAIPTPKFSKKVEHSFVNGKGETHPLKRFSKFQFSVNFYTKFRGGSQERAYAYDTTLFKLPLDQQVKLRISKQYPADAIQLRLKSALKESKNNQIETLRNPINLNHWHKEVTLFNVRRNRKIFSQGLESIYSRNLQKYINK